MGSISVVFTGRILPVVATTVPLTAGKTVEAVTLPSLGSVTGYQAALHIFALSAG
jgi:hypothetical protein